MKKFILALTGATMVASLMFAGLASAHEHGVFQIGNKRYRLVIGSLNEPLTVDDKTGVDFRVSLLKGSSMSMSGSMAMSDEEDAGTPVTGLEKTLKVEISAGGKKKVLDLDPAYGQPGAYRAPFYPSVQTTYTYRFFGTINDAPVDLSFPCTAGEVSESSEDKTHVKISEQVMREEISGGFGCPAGKSDLMFPESAPSISEISATAMIAQQTAEEAQKTRGLAIAALALGAIGCAGALGAFMKMTMDKTAKNST